jgi:hypothetical protein
MAGMYVPRSKEMVTGSLRRTSWKINHLLTTANYFVEEAGFPQLEESYRMKNKSAPAAVISSKCSPTFGNILDVDDAAVNAVRLS